MKMKTLDLAGISVYVDREAHTIYEELVSRSSKKAEDHPFATMKDLFIMAACVGAQRGRFEELSSRRDIFSGELFDSKTEVPVLAALAYHRTKDIEVLSDAKKVVQIAQGWANGGIHIVREELLERPGRPLYNLVEMLLSEVAPS
jgi:dnd system-associated protein 4